MTENSVASQPNRRNVLTIALGTGLVVSIGASVILPSPINDNNPGCPTPPLAARGANSGKQPAVCYAPALITRKMGISVAQYLAFREGVASIEDADYGEMGGAGRHYAGRYQMGKREIQESADALGLPTPTIKVLLSDPVLQERLFERYTLDHHEYLMGHNARYAEAAAEQKLEILARAHNEGAAGASSWLNTGAVHLDGFGTDPAIYAKAVRRRLSRLSK